MVRIYHQQGDRNMAAYAHTTTRICRVLMGLAVLWSIIGRSGAGSWAYDGKQTHATLRGLQGVNVLIEALEPDVERVGLTKQQLQTDVELRLRQAGIHVLTREERLEMPGSPYLYINVNIILRSEGLAAFNIDVELRQEAFLATDSSLATVSTWSVGQTGSVGRLRLSDIRNNVRDYVDQFINAYLSVHPQPASSPAPSSTAPRRDLIRQVQERLQAAGFKPGTIDGTMGTQTRDALCWFQNTKGLRPTGEPDEATLDALSVR